MVTILILYRAELKTTSMHLCLPYSFGIAAPLCAPDYSDICKLRNRISMHFPLHACHQPSVMATNLLTEAGLLLLHVLST